jgi:hypothetical protein
MNERIKELAEQATTITYEEDGWRLYGTEVETFNKEKFAKLIVEECMWKIMTRKEEAIDNNWRVDEAMSAAISDISEHFGVEQ